MPFGATWIHLETIILSDAIQTVKDKHHMILLTCGIYKKIMDTNELIGRLKTDSQTEKLVVTKGDGWGGGWRDGLGIWDWHMHTEIHGMIGQWEPALKHRVLYPLFCDHLWGKRI